MNFLGKYSNSLGHLIMSVVLIVTGLVLILLTTDATLHGIGVTLIMTPSGYWFVTSAAVHSNNSTGPLPPAPTQPPAPQAIPPAVVAAPKGAPPRG